MGNLTTVGKTTVAGPLSGDQWTRERVELLKRTYCKGATDDEFALFIGTSKRLQLSPEARQVFAVKRWNNKENREEMSIQISIDGARLVAQRSGKYRGQLGPFYSKGETVFDEKTATHRTVWYDSWPFEEAPKEVKVGVLHADFEEPQWATARYGAYVQTTKDGKPNAFWKRMPDVMLAKCFDERTEVLTETGFRLFSEVTDRVMQVTENGLTPTDAKPFVQEYAGDMVNYFSDDLNFSVTPNHDMITTTGKISAETMFMEAKCRPSFFIPRSAPAQLEGLEVDEKVLELVAAFLCDGEICSGSSFRIKVSKPRKVNRLRELGLARSEKVINCAGKVSYSPSGRKIITKNDQISFSFDFSKVAEIATPGKLIPLSVLEKLSSMQCKVLVESWLFFDGNFGSGGGKDRTARIYTSNTLHVGLIEFLAVKAGYAVSRSEVETEWKKRYTISLSARDAIPVYRRNYAANYPSLHKAPNSGNRVWCVTVPSGAIIVRRDGFSMICGNCGESLALRKAFPNELSGVYTVEEMGNANKDRNGNQVHLDIQDRIEKMLLAFSELHTKQTGDSSAGMVLALEDIMGKKLANLDEVDLKALQKMYSDLAAGKKTWADVFSPPQAIPVTATTIDADIEKETEEI